MKHTFIDWVIIILVLFTIVCIAFFDYEPSNGVLYVFIAFTYIQTIEINRKLIKLPTAPKPKEP